MSTMDLIANETIEALRPHATPAEMQRAILLTNDVRKAMVALKEESSQATRKNLVHAEQVQAEFVGDLVNRYLSGSSDTPDTTDDRFPHKLAAWEYLRDSGWQIGRSQFYEHCKQGRLPRKDGHYLRDDVDRYAKLHCKLEATGEKVNDTLSRMAEEKATTELEREKVRLDRERHELAVKRGEVVDRDEVEQMIVGRAVAMLAHLKAMVQMKAGDWIALVEGNQARARDLIETVQSGIEEHLAVFARDIEFEVIFEKNTKEVADGQDSL